MRWRMAAGRDAKSSPDTYVVGLIADTHGLVRPQVAEVFVGVDLIVHAGDVGGRAVIESLSRIARVEAVFGNVDDPHDPGLSREQTIPLAAGITLHVTHGHELGRPTAERIAARYAGAGDVLVFGHTHQAVVIRTRGRDGRAQVVVNPGAAGPRRFNVQPSVARLTVSRGDTEVEIIPLK
jgi:uncharacterized protein